MSSLKGKRFVESVEGAIKESFAPPKVIKNFFSDEDIQYLLEYKKSCVKVSKNTGIINYKYEKGCELEKWLLHKLKEELGSVVRHGGSFVETTVPFRVHTDTGKNEEMRNCLFPFKNVLIPLSDSTLVSPKYTVFFKQRSLFEASHFMRGNIDIKPTYNNIIDNYEGLINLTSENFCSREHQKHLSHLSIDELYGLSIDNLIHWHIRDIILFDCSQLHSSNDFKVESKKSLSLFCSKLI